MSNAAINFFASRYSVRGGDRARFLYAARKGTIPAPTFAAEEDYVLHAAQEAASRGDLPAAAFELAVGAYGAGGDHNERYDYFAEALGIAA